MMRILITLLAVLVLSSCERGGSGLASFGNGDILQTENTDKFLEFFNRQESLPADKDYQLVIGTETAGDSGSFTGTITFDDGSTQEFSGDIDSGFPGVNGAMNGTVPFTMQQAGGITVNVNSSLNTCLYLENENGDIYIGPSGILYDVPDGTCQFTTQLTINPNQTDTERYANAYYQAVDPANERDTLEKWRTKNGFGEACTLQTESKFGQCEVTAIFRDTKDVGYGRLMYARREDRCSNQADNTATCSSSSMQLSNFAVYVENFQVDAIPGQQYTELNLEAIINDSRRWHFGTNAIEFNNEHSSTGELYAKFYTFVANQSTDNGRRLTVVDLDERGEKAVPANCLHCHGGSIKRLLPSNFSLAAYLDNIGDLQGQLKPIEVNTLQFADVDGFRQTDQEPAITFINQGILDTYKVLQAQNTPYKQAYWNPDDAITLIEGWYGGVDGNNEFINTTFDASYVLPDWDPAQNGSVPNGADDIFRQVVLPNCLTCHLTRGNNMNERENLASYADFAAYNDIIESYVYEQANMPSGALNFNDFWDNESIDKPRLLSQLISGFSHTDNNGDIIRPGNPVAVIVAPSSTDVPATISAAGSVFAQSYQWDIISTPGGANASFDNANTITPTFDTDQNGNYEIRLTVTKASGETNSATQIINVDSGKPEPRNLTFSDISSNMNTFCVDCHFDYASRPHPGGFSPYTDSCGYSCHTSDSGAFRLNALQANTDLYSDTIERINFADPLKSKLLSKPANLGDSHGDKRATETVSGFNLNGTMTDRVNYDLYLNWILEGAPQ